MRIILRNKKQIIVVEDWFAEQQGIRRMEANQVRETEHAICVRFVLGNECWIPKNVFKVAEIPAGLEAWI